MQRFSLLLFALLFSPFSFGQKKDYLVVFTDFQAPSRVVNDFNQNYLDKIKELGGSTGIEVVVRDRASGFPAEVTALPAIYYIGPGKQVYYKGRYSYVDKIKTFINNQRTFTFDLNALEKDRIFVKEEGGFEIGLVPKFYDLQGEVPSDFKPEDMQAAILGGLGKGLTSFEYKPNYTFKEVSKLFYLDFYPYRSSDGTIWVSIEVFSQHSCVEPVFQKMKVPFSAVGMESVAGEVGQYMDGLMPELFHDLNYHDGLYVVPQNTNRVDWKTLGLNPSHGAEVIEASGAFPSGSYQVNTTEKVNLSFSFLPPVSHYAGTIPSLKGDFSYQEGRLKGTMSVAVSQMDMGDESLNEYVKADELQEEKYPEIVLRFDHPLEDIQLGSRYKLPATLVLTGIEKEVEVGVTFRQFSEDPSEISVEASFSFSVNPFPSLEKPDGPAPFNETIMVATAFTAGPATAGASARAGAMKMKSGKVEFDSKKMKLTSATEEFQADLNLESGQVNVMIDLSTFVFPSDLYQKHALGKQGLQADLFPKASFEGKASGDTDLTQTGEHKVRMKGILTLHGESRPYELDAVINNQPGGVSTSGEFLLNREEFKLTGSRAKLLDKDIKILVNMEF